MQTAKIYLVGGAVRDHLLGIESRDRDYVVVGSSPAEMLAEGFTQVGASFPVFLHPVTGDEYALARTERKTGAGYHGFETFYDKNVTLEDDLARRDLTINSMAMVDGVIIDPFGGREDLSNGVLRHTSDAFADDPLRVLRLARFAARYSFSVAPETLKLARKIVWSGELLHLPHERVWTELYKGFSEVNAFKMLEVLTQIGALSVDPLHSYFGHRFDLDVVSKLLPGGDTADERVLLSMDFSSSNEVLNELRVPSNLRDSARLATQLAKLTDSLTPELVLDLLKQLRFGFNDRLALKVAAVRAISKLKMTVWEKNLEVVARALAAIKKVDMAAVVASGPSATAKDRVEAARMFAIRSTI